MSYILVIMTRDEAWAELKNIFNSIYLPEIPEPEIDPSKELGLSKEFYDLTHSIAYKNIQNGEKTVERIKKLRENLDILSSFEKSIFERELKSYEEMVEMNLNFILDCLNLVDKTISNLRDSVEDPENLSIDEKIRFLKKNVDPDIFEIDIL